MHAARVCRSAGIASSLAGVGSGIRTFHSCPPSWNENICPLGRAMMCAGSISGTTLVVTRSCEEEVKSVRASGSAVSVAPETKVRVCTLTFGS
ncbi:hypothetical protein D3C78_1633930 [compost metagenome]